MPVDGPTCLLLPTCLQVNERAACVSVIEGEIEGARRAVELKAAELTVTEGVHRGSADQLEELYARLTRAPTSPSPSHPHRSPRTAHPSPLTPHRSPLTPHPSPLTAHRSPLTAHPHRSPITLTLALALALTHTLSPSPSPSPSPRRAANKQRSAELRLQVDSERRVHIEQQSYVHSLRSRLKVAAEL